MTATANDKAVQILLTIGDRKQNNSIRSLLLVSSHMVHSKVRSRTSTEQTILYRQESSHLFVILMQVQERLLKLQQKVSKKFNIISIKKIIVSVHQKILAFLFHHPATLMTMMFS